MAQNNTRIIVIGAGYAGMIATARLAGKTRRQPVTITLINGTPMFVERLRLHQVAANQEIRQYAIPEILRGTGVNFIQGWVKQIDTPGYTLSVQTPEGEQRLHYDKLIYALGSTIDVDSVPGAREYAYRLTPDGERSALSLRKVLPELNEAGGRLLVCGGGATGIEAAAEFAESYPNLRVHLVTRGAFGLFVSKTAADYMRQSLHRLGVTLQEQTTIAEIRMSEAVTTMGECIPFDLCLWTGGFAVPQLAREAEIAVNDLGQLLSDPYLRSISHPDIYAAGDSWFPVEEPGVAPRMSAFMAAITGAYAADALVAYVRGKTPKPLSFATYGQGIALGRKDAIGFSTYPDDKAKAPYFTGKLGVEVREFFVRFLADLPNLEKRMPGMLYWMGKGRYAAQKRRVDQIKQVGQSA